MTTTRTASSWTDFLTMVFQKTYSGILTDKEIQDRVVFIVSNMNSLDVQSLFRTVLYSDTENEIGRLAIDFRLRFITMDYASVIKEGVSRELESDFPERELVRKETEELCSALGLYVN